MKASVAERTDREGLRSLTEQVAILNELLGVMLILGFAVGIAFMVRGF